MKHAPGKFELVITSIMPELAPINTMRAGVTHVPTGKVLANYDARIGRLKVSGSIELTAAELEIFGRLTGSIGESVLTELQGLAAEH